MVEREKVVTEGGIDWNGPLTILVTGLVSVLVEYLRRRMPPERYDRREEDHPDDEDKKEKDKDDE